MLLETTVSVERKITHNIPKYGSHWISIVIFRKNDQTRVSFPMLTIYDTSIKISMQKSIRYRQKLTKTEWTGNNCCPV